MRADSFAKIIDEYGPALRRLCAAYCRDAADQQDLFQEIALALWTALPRFRGDSSERTWLYRVAHNVAITYRGRRARLEQREVQMEAPVLPVPENGERQLLLDCVRDLEPVARELALLYLEGLSACEIGDVLGITEGNAAVRLTRLRQKLTEILNPQEQQR